MNAKEGVVESVSEEKKVLSVGGEEAEGVARDILKSGALP